MGAEAQEALIAGGRIGVVPDQTPVAAATFALGQIPRGLRLDRVARSHGWSGLPPWGYAAPERLLHTTLWLPGRAARVWIDRDWSVHAELPLDPIEQAYVIAALRWCLGLDDDVRGAPPVVRATRMLRSQTVWEDLVKVLCTTNCSWAATTGMVRRLVETFGIAGTFPTPDAVAAASGEALAALRLGYRLPSLTALASSCADGSLDPEHWRSPAVSDAEVLGEVRSLRGFGAYAAESMLGLLGRPRGLAIDSWICAVLESTAPQLREAYERHGKWAGAVLWQDVTASWFAKASG